MRTDQCLNGQSPNRRLRALLLASIALASALGLSALQAGDKGSKDGEESERKEPKTIGEVVSVAGLQSYPVEGIGLVVGLDGTGCDPIPGADRNALVLDMQKRGVKEIEDILRSTSTALVKVRARIPPAVRSCKTAGCWCRDKNSKRTESQDALKPHRGDTFDVEIEAPARDGTTSLKGGWLLETWLYETAALPGVGVLPGHVFAKASGPLLVTGSLEGQAATPADLKRARVLGGGIATEDRQLALVTDSDRTAKWTIQIASRVNDRFPLKTRDGKSLAEPKNGQQILLKVPPRYRQNMARYLEVLRYIPLSETTALEVQRMEWYEEDLGELTKSRQAAARLEGMGHRAAQILYKGLENPNPDIQFFAAEALAYMDDPKSGEVLARTAREIPEYRAHALAALSALDEPISPLKLRELMTDSNSVELRYGAFRALRVLDPDDTSVPAENVGDQMFMHQVVSTGAPLIHVSSRERAELVLFGRDLQFFTPLLLNAGSSIVISAGDASDELVLSRVRKGEPVMQRTSSTKVRDVVRKAVALGATYPDIVGMLVQADKQHNLPARLEFDAAPDPTRMLARLQKISNTTGKAAENVAMPNLYRWTEARRSAGKELADADDDSTSDSDDETNHKYLTKPSVLDRIRRRTAN